MRGVFYEPNPYGMCRTKLLLFLFCVVIFTSCQPPVSFTKPQPVDGRTLAIMPMEYKGIFWCQLDSALVYINDHALIKRKEFLIKTTMDEIRSCPNFHLENGSLMVKDRSYHFPVRMHKDTILCRVVLTDTLFVIDEPQNLLRTYKGHLLLNTKLKVDSWEVGVLSIKRNGLLNITKAEKAKALLKLDSIDLIRPQWENDRILSRTHVSPTLSQFENLLQQGLQINCNCKKFERIITMQEGIYRYYSLGNL